MNEQLLFADARWLWVLLPLYVIWSLLWWLRPRWRHLAARRGFSPQPQQRVYFY